MTLYTQSTLEAAWHRRVEKEGRAPREKDAGVDGRLALAQLWHAVRLDARSWVRSTTLTAGYYECAQFHVRLSQHLPRGGMALRGTASGVDTPEPRMGLLF